MQRCRCDPILYVLRVCDANVLHGAGEWRQAVGLYTYIVSKGITPDHHTLTCLAQVVQRCPEEQIDVVTRVLAAQDAPLDFIFPHPTRQRVATQFEDSLATAILPATTPRQHAAPHRTPRAVAADTVAMRGLRSTGFAPSPVSRKLASPGQPARGGGRRSAGPVATPGLGYLTHADTSSTIVSRAGGVVHVARRGLEARRRGVEARLHAAASQRVPMMRQSPQPRLLGRPHTSLVESAASVRLSRRTRRRGPSA